MEMLTLNIKDYISQIENSNSGAKEILQDIFIAWKHKLIPRAVTNKEIKSLRKYYSNTIIVVEDENRITIGYFEIAIFVPHNSDTHRQFAYLRNTYLSDFGENVSLKNLIIS